jgi:hypothetical protein
VVVPRRADAEFQLADEQRQAEADAGHSDNPRTSLHAKSSSREALVKRAKT